MSLGRQQNSQGRICPKCKERRLLSGDSSKYNPRSNDGVQICTPCRVEELTAPFRRKREIDDEQY